MRLPSLSALLLTTLLLTPVAAQPAAATAVPDMSQEDPGLNGGGDQFCAPVSVSNSLWWFSKNGYPKLAAASQVAMVQKFAVLMKTHSTGTGPVEMMDGARSYVEAAGYSATFAERGWRQRQPAGVDEAFLLSALGQSKACWVNVGWYKSKGQDFDRAGGHWVTLVGVRRDAQGLTLLVHDPSARMGKVERTDELLLAKLSAGRLLGNNKGLPRSAAGLYRVAKWNGQPRGYEAIVDHVVTMTLR